MSENVQRRVLAGLFLVHGYILWSSVSSLVVQFFCFFFLSFLILLYFFSPEKTEPFVDIPVPAGNPAQQSCTRVSSILVGGV